MNNKLILCSCVTSMFLVWLMYIRENWPSLIHIQACGVVLLSISHCQIFCVYVSLVSKSDCYVSLWLPTASDEKFHTKTIKNCRNPIWNETFYFRIQRQIKVDKPKTLFFTSSLYSFFQFDPKQDVISSNVFLNLLKILLASLSKTIRLLPESTDSHYHILVMWVWSPSRRLVAPATKWQH